MGTNTIPLKVTDSGYILTRSPHSPITIYPYSYSVFKNGILYPINGSAQAQAFEVSDITEDGTMVGDETSTITLDTDNGDGTTSSNSVTVTGIQTWTPGQTPGPANHDSPANAPRQIYAQSVDMAGFIDNLGINSRGAFPQEDDGPNGGDYRILASGVSIDAQHHIWSNCALTSSLIVPNSDSRFALFDGFKDQTKLGSAAPNYGTGQWVSPGQVTQSGKAIYYASGYTTNPTFYGRTDQNYYNDYRNHYYDTVFQNCIYDENGTQTPLSFIAYGLNDDGVVIGSTDNGATGLWWTSSTGSHPNAFILGSPGRINAAQTTAPLPPGQAGPPTTQYAYQAIGNATSLSSWNLLWELFPATSLADAEFKPPLSLNDLITPAAGYSQIDAWNINKSGEITATATHTQIPLANTTHAILLIPASFNLRDDTTVFQGWDGASSSSDHNAWTTVGVNAANQLIKLTLPPNAANLGLECVVDDTDNGYSSSCISLAPLTLTGGDNNLEVTGIKKTNSTIVNPTDLDKITSIPAHIVLRVKSSKQVLLNLNVIVLPIANLTVDVFYAFDPTNNNSVLPSEYPANTTDAAVFSATIINKLNGYYNNQAHVSFVLGNSYILNSGESVHAFNATSGLVNFDPNNFFNSPVNSLVVGAQGVDTATKHIWLFVVKGIHPTSGSIPYLAVSVNQPHAESYVPALTNLNDFYITCGHEIGRDLDLSAISSPQNFKFDFGPWPLEFKDDGDSRLNQTGLMSNNSGPQTPWIRHEDWQEANGYATNSTLYH